jgi:hypothetical protein
MEIGLLNLTPPSTPPPSPPPPPPVPRLDSNAAMCIIFMCGVGFMVVTTTLLAIYGVA